MPRKNEGHFTGHCRYYAWEVGGGCLAEAAMQKCDGCQGSGLRGASDHDLWWLDCLKCSGTGLGQKAESGERCHQARADCQAYYPTLMFSCGEGGD